MKIVVIANDSNGLYLFRRQLISALIDGGNTVSVLTPFDTDVENLRNLGVELTETPIDRRGTNLIRDYRLFKKYKKELKRIKPDMVLTYTIKPNIYGGLACRMLRIPYAANITGLGTAFEGDGILRKAVTILNKIALKKVKVVFFENSSGRDVFVKERIVKTEKTYVLNGAGVDLEHFSYQPYPTDKATFRFLFIGRIMKEKGVDELLDAMENLSSDGISCSLDILGNYEEDYKEKLDNASKNWLTYHGNQPDVRPFIANSHCFVLPSYHEGMANTNLECAATGRPIITSDIPGCQEAVIDGITGFVCRPKDAEDLYRAMKKMTELSNEQRAKMGEEGRKHMEQVFDKKKIVEETINVLLG